MYKDKETGAIVTLDEIKKEYMEIKSNVDFITLGITGWDTLEDFIKDCYVKN